jgi:hypothetical protein
MFKFKKILSNEVPETLFDDWDKLESDDKQNSMFTSSYWLKMVAQSDGLAQKMILAFENDVLVGGLCFDVVQKGFPNHYNIESLLNGYNPFYKKVPNVRVSEQLMPSLTITSRAARSCDFRYHPSFSLDKREKLLKEILVELEICQKEKNAKSITFLYVPSSANTLHSILKNNEFDSMLIGSRYYIPIDFENFDGYINNLKSKRRTVVRSEIRKAEKYGVTFETGSLSNNLEQFVSLVSLNFKKYGFSGFEYNSYLKCMKLLAEFFGEKAYVLNMKVNQEIVGSLLLIHYKNVLNARAVGISDLPNQIAPYFNLVFYQGIKQALELNVDYLEFGDGLDETKLSRRCEAEFLYVYCKGDKKLEEPFKEIDNHNRLLLEGFLKEKYSRI